MAAPFSANSDSRSRPTSASDEDEDDEQGGGASGAVAAKIAWGDRRMRPWLVAGLLGGHAQAAVMGIIGFLILDRLGLRATPSAGAGPTGLVLMAGAAATLLAQWGIIPFFRMGPRTSCLWGMGLAALGTAMLSVAGDIHSIALGMILASLGFGMFRPGFTSGASLAVSRAEQGQSAGIVASVNGAAYIFAPAIGVWLYGHSPWIGFAAIELLCLGVIVLGLRTMSRDEVLLGQQR
jgi:hypothetical protein